MLAGANRLRRTRDIERVRARGRSVGNRVLRVQATPNGLKRSRATVVVSSRTAKRAVVRNRIKRQVRSIVRPLLTRMTPPRDLVVVVQRGALELSFAELSSALTGLLGRLAERRRTH
jgi:ribonuclease P protein component